MASLSEMQNENDKNTWQIDDVHVKKLNGSIKNQFLIKTAKIYSKNITHKAAFLFCYTKKVENVYYPCNASWLSRVL